MLENLKSNTRVTILSILSYLGPLCFVSLMNKDSEFVHFHAKQGLVLWAISNLLILFILIPFFGGHLIKLLTVFLIFLSLIGIVNVLLHRKSEIPLLGQLAHLI